MTSLRARLLPLALRLQGRKADYRSAEAVHRRIARERGRLNHEPPSQLRREHRVSVQQVEGAPVYTVAPRVRSRRPPIVYVHGGAFIAEIKPQHWSFISRLVRATGRAVVVPIYPLAPEHDARDMYRVLGATWALLTGEHPRTAPVLDAARDARDPVVAGPVLVGDSAGGGLALGLAQLARDHGAPRPSLTALLSPWLDVAVEDPLSIELDQVDPWLSVPGLREAGRLVAGADRPDHPLVSPLYGEVGELGPVAILTGTRDLLLPDSRRLRDRLREAGEPYDYYEAEGMVHVWMLTPIPEASLAFTHLVQLIRDA